MYMNNNAASDGWRSTFMLAYVQNSHSQAMKVETGVTRAEATCGCGSWLCGLRVQDTVNKAQLPKPTNPVQCIDEPKSWP